MRDAVFGMDSIHCENTYCAGCNFELASRSGLEDSHREYLKEIDAGPRAFARACSAAGLAIEVVEYHRVNPPEWIPISGSFATLLKTSLSCAMIRDEGTLLS